MPKFTMSKINIGESKFTRMILTLADKSWVYPYRILKNVLVNIESFVFPNDFVVLDMVEDLETQSFLVTDSALIDWWINRRINVEVSWRIVSVRHFWGNVTH